MLCCGVLAPVTSATTQGIDKGGKVGRGKKVKASQNIGRESLNLRFGIHGTTDSAPFFVGHEMPMFA